MNEFGWTPEQRRKIWDERIKPAHNELVISDLTVGRLLGLAEDRTDFYYVYGFMHTGVVFSTCVGGYIRINKVERYDINSRIFDLNFKLDEAEVLEKAGTEFNVFLREEDLP